MFRTAFRSLSTILVMTASLISSAVGQIATPPHQISEGEDCLVNEQAKTKTCKYDYQADGKRMEALTVRPIADGRYPGVVLLAGREGAKAASHLGALLASRGFACLAISEPGFGASEGKRDFMGPASIAAFAVGFEKFRREDFVQSDRIGIFGYSRGGMAASLLTLRVGRQARAAVLAAGVYDLKRAYEETRFDDIRENIKTEAGLSEDAFKERSSILQMAKLQTPVLIIHGENDDNVPTDQALLLRDRLKDLHKDFEFVILSDHKHGELKGNFIFPVIEFLTRRLKQP
jgi:dipeptidyl aminopeptidase/acylaminoacyl peptidase